jgi:hypothetical protein
LEAFQKAVFKGIAVIALCAAGLLVVLYWFDQSEYYAIINDTDSKHVYVERKPTSCDFITAPLGSKNCHWEKVVQTLKDDKGVVSVSVNYTKVEE